MRTGGSFRVVLHRKGRLVLYPDTLYRTIVQVHMGDLYVVGILHSLWVHTEAVVLGSYFAFACFQVLHRVVQAAVTVVHFKGRDVIGPCQQLVAQADTEERLAGRSSTSFTVFTA